jgi:hypothetical protein
MTNADHAHRALAALALNSDPSPTDAIVDLLADLRHACDLLELDYRELDRIAHTHYRDEIGLDARLTPETV